MALIKKTVDMDNIMKIKCKNSIDILLYLTDEDFYTFNDKIFFHKVPVVVDGKEMILYTLENKKLRRKFKDDYDYFNCYDNQKHFDFLIDTVALYEDTEITINSKDNLITLKNENTNERIIIDLMNYKGDIIREKIINCLVDHYLGGI